MLTRTIALAIGLLTGIASSQLPEFGQQYRQRLGGAIDELRIVMRQFDTDATASGLDRAKAVEHLVTNPDLFLQRRGASVKSAAMRLDNLEEQQKSMNGAGSFGRLISLMENADGPLLNNTLNDFEPAVPVTSEGFIIGGGGFLVGWAGVLLAGLPFRRRHAPRLARRY